MENHVVKQLASCKSGKRLSLEVPEYKLGYLKGNRQSGVSVSKRVMKYLDLEDKLLFVMIC